MEKRFDLKLTKQRIGIVTRGDPQDIPLARELHELLTSNGIDVLIDERTAQKIAHKMHVKGCDISEIDADFIICIGGDGTILRTLHHIRRKIPILGVNTGALGFLTDVQPENAVDVISNIIKTRTYSVEREERLSVSVEGERAGGHARGDSGAATVGAMAFETSDAGRVAGDVSGEIPYAMNEAVVITAKPGKMLHFVIFMDGEEIERVRADGVILATPTGSTAYAMSAGGPIVDTRVEAMVIVPIAPFKLAARPLVVDIDRNISIATLSEKEAELVIDGQFRRKISSDERILVTRGEPAYFVRVRKYQLRVKEKLWQVR